MTNLYKKLQQKGYSHRSHSEVSKDLDKLETEQQKKTPSGKWKKKYECKRNKGNHEFVLTLPGCWFYRNNPNITIEKFYRGEIERANEQIKEKKLGNKNIERGYFRMWFDYIFIHWKCIHCGKLESDNSKRPRKKIRTKLKNPNQYTWLLNFKHETTSTKS